MWILSQDKVSLIEVKRIVVNITPNSYHIFDQSVNGYHVMLGAYSTEEKAIKVLDEIRQRIVFNAQAEYGERFNTFDTLSAMENTIVYQMPQDNEVE